MHRASAKTPIRRRAVAVTTAVMHGVEADSRQESPKRPWVWCLALSAVLAAGAAAYALLGNSGAAVEVAHVFVQIADPQLGMLNQYGANPSDWRSESDMFARLMNQAVHLQPEPSFIFIGGDMQNFWPNEDGLGRNPNLTIGGEDLGVHQRREVNATLAVAERHGIPVHFTPGNHDVGDEPNANNMDTMSMYSDSWGPHYEVVLHEHGILYLQLNSQLYFNSDSLLNTSHKQLQSSWLDAQLEQVSSETKLLVLLTHIPPFIDDVDEPSGWSNWRKDDRKEVLDSIVSKLGKIVPVLWVCGHFHSNVQKSGLYKGVPMHIRVTSAAGTTMQWNGKASFTPAEAAAIATKDIGSAFDDNIVSGNPANIAERLQAVDSRSGMRIFIIYTDGTFEDRFATVQDLERTNTLSLGRSFHHQLIGG